MGGQGLCMSWALGLASEHTNFISRGEDWTQSGMEKSSGWLAASPDADWPGRGNCSGPGRRVLFKEWYSGDDAEPCIILYVLSCTGPILVNDEKGGVSRLQRLYIEESVLCSCSK